MLFDGALGAVDPEEIDERVISGPKIDIATVNSMSYQVADYMQWQDGVDAHDFQMLATVQAKLLITSVAQMAQSTLPFPVVPSLFKLLLCCL